MNQAGFRIGRKKVFPIPVHQEKRNTVDKLERFLKPIPYIITIMKKILLIAGITFALGACNNNGQQEDSADTVNHSTQHGTIEDTDASTSMQSTDTAGMSGKSMMSIMQSNMDQMKGLASTGNPDNDFASMMKVHHMGALEMAQLQMAKGTDTQLKQMAQKMIEAQQSEIAELNTFLSGHSAHGGGDAFHKEAISKMNNMKMDMDHSGSIDRQFAQMMVPHHQGAIDMSRSYLKLGAHEEKLKTMANKIIADQEKEIRELQAWLNKNK